MSTRTAFKSPLHEMTATTVTDYWNDSCAVGELTYALEHGAVGATSNPTIVLTVLKQEMSLWADRVAQIIAENPTWTETEITWRVFEEVVAHGAKLLMPVYERTDGKKGRLSIQTNPANYRSPQAIIDQAMHFSTLAPNLQVKIPTTQAGIQAIEEVIYRGVSMNATVSFTVSQSIAVAEAVERGLARRRAEGKSNAGIVANCTIMVGRVDDWMTASINRDNLTTHPTSPVWAGVAVMKKAYSIYQERGYSTRLLAAAYRHHLHWSEFIGGDLALSMPCDWAKRFNASDVAVIDRMAAPVAGEIVDDLYTHLPEFRKAYDADGLTVAEFDTYGATVRTLRGFIGSYHELIALIREKFMLPNPDVKA
jgi:transaldolase